MKKKNEIQSTLIILLLLLITTTIKSKECIHLNNKSGAIAVGQQVIDLQLTYQSSLDLIEDNQENLSDNTQSIIDTIDGINGSIQELLDRIQEDKKPTTKQTIEELQQQIQELQLQILALESELDSLIVLYEDMEQGEAEIQVKIGQIWDLQIKADSFPFKNFPIFTKQGFLGGIFDFLGEFDAIFGGVAAFDAAFSILFDILLDFAGGERSKMLKKYRQSIEKQISKTIRYKKSLPKTKIINQPGIYKLKTGTQSGIKINASNVILDLDDNTILADTTTGITIEPNKKNIIIKNGSIMGGDNYIESPAGIMIKQGSQLILVEDVDISFCHKAIFFSGTEQQPITHCKIQHCIFDSNLKSIVLDHTNKTSFYRCKLHNCFEQAIEENSGNENAFDNIVEL